MEFLPQMIVLYNKYKDIDSIIITSFSDHLSILNLEDLIPSHQNYIKDRLSKSSGYKIIGLPYFYLSPILLIRDLKLYIIEELSDIILPSDTSPEDITLWSPFFNIEYYSPSGIIFNPLLNEKNQFTMNNNMSDQGGYFNGGVINISLEVETLGLSSSKIIKAFDSEEVSFYRPLFKSQYLARDQFKYTDRIMSNVFQSSFVQSDYYDLQKCIPIGYKISMSINNNGDIFLTGHTLPLKYNLNNKSRSDNSLRFIIIIMSPDGDEKVTIDDEKVVVNDLTIFDYIVERYVTYNSNFSIPDRFNHSCTHVYEINTNFNSNTNLYTNSDIFFDATNNWNAKNVLITKNKKVFVFLSRRGIKIKHRDNNQYMNDYIVSLILGYSNMLSHEESKLSFGKFKGIYWSRICQNVKDEIRQPIRGENNNGDYSIEGNESNNDNESNKSSVVINSEKYSCSEDVNGKNKFIGFLSKPYTSSKICLPCCYQNDQTSKMTYKKCTNKDILSSAITSITSTMYSLFLIDSYRLLSQSRLGFLDITIDKFLNEKSSITMNNKLLIECKEYYLAAGNGFIEFVESVDNIILHLNEPDHHQDIIIYNTSFYTSPFIKPKESIQYYTVFRGFLFRVVRVTKEVDIDSLIVESSYPIHPNVKVIEIPSNTNNYYLYNIMKINTPMKELEHLSDYVILEDEYNGIAETTFFNQDSKKNM